jgi:hypothetical protein
MRKRLKVNVVENAQYIAARDTRFWGNVYRSASEQVTESSECDFPQTNYISCAE